VRRGWPGGGAEIGRGVIVSVFFFLIWSFVVLAEEEKRESRMTC
jgi:hypothetical protein